jgi:hypothetical protein
MIRHQEGVVDSFRQYTVSIKEVVDPVSGGLLWSSIKEVVTPLVKYQ